jgi:hypothetical protein
MGDQDVSVWPTGTNTATWQMSPRQWSARATYGVEYTFVLHSSWLTMAPKIIRNNSNEVEPDAKAAYA